MLPNVKVGITSWTEKSLVASGWYPKNARTAEARLRYYASRFPIVEVDSTHYAIPSLHQAEVWVERTPDDFTINVKAFATMTEHYTDPKRLPADLREALPPAVAARERVYPKHLGDELVGEIARRFRAAIEPLRASGKLGVVLFQYPVWVPCSAAARRLLARTPSLVPGCRVAVELRNATWMIERNRERTLDLFRDAGIVYTCVDEPQGFPSSIPPIAEVTADIALVRMHGRGAATWAKAMKGARERFRYRYSLDELREWVPKIRRLAADASNVHVLFNNCYSDYAVTNAGELLELLEEPSPVTRSWREHPEHVPRAP